MAGRKNEHHRQMLTEQLRQRAAVLLKLLDKIEDGEQVESLRVDVICGDVEAAARYLRKHYRRQRL